MIKAKGQNPRFFNYKKMNMNYSKYQLNPLRMESLYGGTAAGYTDYPALAG